MAILVILSLMDQERARRVVIAAIQIKVADRKRAAVPLVRMSLVRARIVLMRIQAG
jgi:hypothetical protein